ncbi:hypothetical protein F5146DRAFT_1225793 [Armillaria mellea]|nr:hypothetical protein F5146DRAFT_1225793 [Armillaria mellea]
MGGFSGFLETSGNKPSAEQERVNIKKGIYETSKQRVAIVKEYKEYAKSISEEQSRASDLGLEYPQVGAKHAALKEASPKVQLLSSSVTMMTFPPELVEMIVYEAWHSEMPSYIRKRLMTACPSINRAWKAVYASIASQDTYITNLAFLDYLCRIAQSQTSIVYHNFIPRLTRTITCFVDLQKPRRERAAKGVYRYLIALPNTLGFQVLFKHMFAIYLSSWFGLVVARNHV